LPGLSGTEVARAARSIRPGLPVIVMTGCPEALDSEPDAAALVAGILRKPFRTEALLGLIAGLEGTQGVESQFASRHPTDGPGTE
jgi:CheY-like chemotaxis protein